MKVEFGEFARPAVEVRISKRELAAEAFRAAQLDYNEAANGYGLAMFGGDVETPESRTWAQKRVIAREEIRRTRDLHERGGVWW